MYHYLYLLQCYQIVFVQFVLPFCLFYPSSLIYEIERIYNEGPTKNFKLLGVLLDEYLTFDDHIITCVRKFQNLFSASTV